jgi:hypothetical protein
LILYGARDGPTDYSQSESQEFWYFVLILYSFLLDIYTISTNNTINIINNNYSYVDIGANKGTQPFGQVLKEEGLKGTR